MVKLKTEFSARNLTIFGGYSNIFSFFTKSNVFEKLDRFISFTKRKKIYDKRDYFKLILSMLVCGFRNMNQVSLFQSDRPIQSILDLDTIPHVSNIARFLKRFTFKSCQQIVDVKRELFKKFHHKAFTLKRVTIDIDTTVLNLWGCPEGAGKGYNPVKRGNLSYHPMIAFIYETKEVLHGVLKPGDTHCVNGAVEFLEELKTMLPYGLRDIIVRTDSGLFSQKVLTSLETKKWRYIVAVKNYAPVLARVADIPDCAYRPYDEVSEVAVFHFRMGAWKKKRKFIVQRIRKSCAHLQEDLFGYVPYEYRIFVTTLAGDPAHLIDFYHKRGTAENYIKELKYDLHIGKLITNSFWANQAIFQLTLLCYNMLVWFKNIFIGKAERQTTIQTFRERYLLIPGKLVNHARRFILKLPRDYRYKETYKAIELQLA